MPVLTLHWEASPRNIPVETGEILLHALRSAGVNLSFPCSGNHTCGKCRVLAAGALSPMTEGEQKLLSGATAGTRLACFCRIEGDCAVFPAACEGGEQIASDFRAGESELDPIYESGYGAAFDIGTTTVVGYLFSHEGREPVAVRGEMNRQQPYGADVLSRIVSCNEHGVMALSSLIREQISGILSELCLAAGISHEDVKGLVVTGNTTMLHIYAGLSPASLALAPFTPESLFGDVYDIPLSGFPNLRSYLPRCISAYVGADITCSILASGIFEQNANLLLVDAGTNGEMALMSPNGLVCCSTAAGPAFEGAGISSGMSAKDGAVNTVRFESGKIRYTTIGNKPAKGLCGSGLIDAVSAFLSEGSLSRSGRVKKELSGMLTIGESGISLTQQDVRQVQLAKAAVRAGMDALLNASHLTYEELGQIIFCGGFGSFIDPVSAAGIGLIEPRFSERTRAIGNAAGSGAGRILQSKKELTKSVCIAQSATTLELSADPYFSKRYLSCMSF